VCKEFIKVWDTFANTILKIPIQARMGKHKPVITTAGNWIAFADRSPPAPSQDQEQIFEGEFPQHYQEAIADAANAAAEALNKGAEALTGYFSSWFGSSSSSSSAGSLQRAQPKDAEPLGCIRVHDIRANAEFISFMDHSDPVSQISFSPSGNLLASSPESGKEVLVYRIVHTRNKGKRTLVQRLYKISRGIFSADIGRISFSSDESWINILSLTRGTVHVVRINPNGGIPEYDRLEDYKFIGDAPIETHSISTTAIGAETPTPMGPKQCATFQNSDFLLVNNGGDCHLYKIECTFPPKLKPSDPPSYPSISFRPPINFTCLFSNDSSSSPLAPDP